MKGVKTGRKRGCWKGWNVSLDSCQCQNKTKEGFFGRRGRGKEGLKDGDVGKNYQSSSLRLMPTVGRGKGQFVS